MISLILTCIAPDRPDLIENLSDTIAAHDANWEESRMSRLAGQFIGILSIRVPDTQADKLMSALGQIENAQITIQKSEEEPVAIEAEAQAARLILSGKDRSGILRDLSKILIRHNIQFGDLQTTCHKKQEGKATTFTAKVTLYIPSNTNLEQLQTVFETISDDVTATLTLS